MVSCESNAAQGVMFGMPSILESRSTSPPPFPLRESAVLLPCGHLRNPGGAPMDFNDSTEQAAWRDEVRTFLKTEKAPSMEGLNMEEMMRAGRERFRDWRQKLSAKGWVAPAWPK